MEGQQRVGAIAELPQVLRELGKDPAEIIAGAGIDPALLRNPENALTFVALGKLLSACVAATGCPHFGLLVGQRSATSSLGVVGRLMQNAPTLKDAILDLCDNQQRYVRGAVSYLIVRGDTAFWGYAVYFPGMQAIDQLSEGAIAVGANMMRELTGVSPQEVLLSRPRPKVTAPYHKLFGPALRFDAEQYALAFPASLLARPVPGANPALRQILKKAVADYWAAAKPSVAERLIRILRARVVFADGELADIAGDLLMQPRTLNRRLQAEGTTFRDLLGEARFGVACQLLAGTRMDVTEIALALGYADTSGFTHAFRRRSDKSPAEWRRAPQQ